MSCLARGRARSLVVQGHLTHTDWCMHAQNLDRLGSERLRQHAKTNPLYARVFFGARRRFGLSLPEVVLCDVVVVLSRKTGWCFASRAYLAGLLGISERSVRRSITQLEEKKLLERKTGSPRQLRATMLWISECQADDVAGQ